ncbi:tubby C-terminal-like domain-containing protein [Syncephalis plumigaleata]|nr:tubby C-terminal-like domain-containing protein [Syncephalis plumigaleata]
MVTETAAVGGTTPVSRPLSISGLSSTSNSDNGSNGAVSVESPSMQPTNTESSAITDTSTGLADTLAGNTLHSMEGLQNESNEAAYYTTTTNQNGGINGQQDQNENRTSLLPSIMLNEYVPLSLTGDAASVDAMLYRPISQGERLLCSIVRKRDGKNRFYPTYELYRDDHQDHGVPLLKARKCRQTGGSRYEIIVCDQDQQERVVGKVRSNFIGTAFVVYDDGRNPFRNDKETSKENDSIRQELAGIIYEPNILGFKGPRRMTILMRRMGPDEQRIPHRPTKKEDTLLGRYNDSLELHNKSPQWNEETQSYVLNFNGRVTLASVKNFNIHSFIDLDYIIMQFGRIARDHFTMDFQYPMCLLQAFGIALSSFDAKLACE